MHHSAVLPITHTHIYSHITLLTPITSHHLSTPPLLSSPIMEHTGEERESAPLLTETDVLVEGLKQRREGGEQDEHSSLLHKQPPKPSLQGVCWSLFTLILSIPAIIGA